jgi:hypothetical protein
MYKIILTEESSFAAQLHYHATVQTLNITR